MDEKGKENIRSRGAGCADRLGLAGIERDRTGGDGPLPLDDDFLVFVPAEPCAAAGRGLDIPRGRL